MKTVRLDDCSLVTFDGSVVEHFYGAKSQRAHGGTIHDISFDMDRNGKAVSLLITATAIGNYQSDVRKMYLWNNNNAPYSEPVHNHLREMVAEIEKAMSAFHADNE